MARRILCVDDALGLWGAQQVLLQLAPLLVPLGIELVLAAPPASALGAAWQGAGLPYVPLVLPTPPPPRTPDGRIRWTAVGLMVASSPRAILAIRRAAREAGADALLANSHPTQLDTAVAGRSLRLPVVLYLHEQLPFAFGRWLRAAAAALSRQVIAVSTPVAEEVRPARAGRVEVVPNGVDTSRFGPGTRTAGVGASLGAAPSELLLVALTRLDPVKRVEDLLEAATHLSDVPPWHLAVVGETTEFPEYAEDLRRRAQELAPGRVSFTGRRHDIPQILQAADLVVHTGTVEGLPLGLLEAQASGTPVVAYRVAGIPDLVQDGCTGLLAEAADVRGISDRITRLLDDATLRHSFGERAACRVRTEFDQRFQARRLAQLLERL